MSRTYNSKLVQCREAKQKLVDRITDLFDDLRMRAINPEITKAETAAYDAAAAKLREILDTRG